jgi:hypothetical protein
MGNQPRPKLMSSHEGTQFIRALQESCTLKELFWSQQKKIKQGVN